MGMKILIDNGHGSDTPGKRSPDGRLREYAWCRETAQRVSRELSLRGIDAILIVPERNDVALRERVRRANAWCGRLGAGNVLLVSIHVNAAGNGARWADARGWQAHVSPNASADSKRLALCLIGAAEEAGLKVRKYSHQVPYWPQNLAVCRDTLCPAVLTENLFMDNPEDTAFLLSEEGREAITRVHVRGIVEFLKDRPK